MSFCWIRVSNPERLFSTTVQPSKSSTSAGEEVMDSNMLFQRSFKTSWKKVTRLKSAAILNETNISQRAKELSVFESTKERTNNIAKLCEALKSVPPTSVEVEKVLYAAGLFINKLRNRLNDN